MDLGTQRALGLGHLGTRRTLGNLRHSGTGALRHLGHLRHFSDFCYRYYNEKKNIKIVTGIKRQVWKIVERKEPKSKDKIGFSYVSCFVMSYVFFLGFQ